MSTCSNCGHKFNTGFTCTDLSLCIQCANEGYMPKDRLGDLQDFNERHPYYCIEQASMLKRRLYNAMFLVIVIGLLTYFFYKVVPYIVPNSQIGLGILLVIVWPIMWIVEFWLGIRWMMVINEALVALEKQALIVRLAACWLIPFYALFLTLYLGAKLTNKGDSTVSHGRLNYV